MRPQAGAVARHRDIPQTARSACFSRSPFCSMRLPSASYVLDEGQLPCQRNSSCPQATTLVSDCEVPSHRSPLPACEGKEELSAFVLPPPRNCGGDWPARVVGVLAFVQQSLYPCLQHSKRSTRTDYLSRRSLLQRSLLTTPRTPLKNITNPQTNSNAAASRRSIVSR
jgi:hypothetical protein